MNFTKKNTIIKGKHNNKDGPDELGSRKRGFRLIGLRGKLLLATLALFILPIAGLSYLKELELFLKKNHAESVLVIAKTISSVFRDNSSLITLNQLTQSPYQAIYCHSLRDNKIIDGFGDDWFALQNRQQYFYPTTNNAIHPTKNASKKSLPSSVKRNADDNNLSLLCANDEQYYYFLITVNKPAIEKAAAFGQVDFINNHAFNAINFQYLDYAHRVQDYNFKLISPGWVNGQPNDSLLHSSKKQIPAEWQENNQGFVLEFKIPISRINRYMAFKLQKSKHLLSNRQTSEMQTLIATAPAIELLKSSDQLNPVIQADPLSVLKLEQLVPQNTRLWLLNKHQYISAKTAQSFNSDTELNNEYSLLALYRRFYLIIMNYPEQQSFYGSNQAQIDSSAIQLTLKGISSADWLDTPHSDKMVLSVTTPVYDNDSNVIGTLVLEQNNETLLALQDKTFERILFLTLILFFSIALILLFLSTRLLKRIINLRDDTNLALSNDGVISNQLYRNDNDEVGDLARSFSTLLSRIDQNNQYLRSLSGKLSHELRTPLTIIKSSLENMDPLSLSDDNKKYTLRANEGCTRLANLLNRMSEASRLEQSINAIEKEKIEMVNFLASYIDAQRAAAANDKKTIEILFQTSLNQLTVNISPELIAQLLDKLFSNAISFHKENTPVSLKLTREKNELKIEINNYGDLIDKNKLNSIFTSLTSYRTKNAQDVHLGLGLYISRLICEFHNGHLKAVNNEQNQSVSFILSMPIT